MGIKKPSETGAEGFDHSGGKKDCYCFIYTISIF